MKRLNKAIALICLLSLTFTVLFFQQADVAYACSGGAPLTLRGLIEEADYVVKAESILMDDFGQTSIVQVETYLAGGSGPEYLMVTQNDVLATSDIVRGRFAGGECNVLRGELRPGETYYLFLSRRVDGGYAPILDGGWNLLRYSFPTSDSTVEVFLESSPVEEQSWGPNHAQKDSGTQVTEQQFVDLIAEQSGENPVEPQWGTPLPLLAPLQITTSSGRQYLLPIDHQPPVEINEAVQEQMSWENPIYRQWFNSGSRECIPNNCQNDGLYVVDQQDENTFLTSWAGTFSGQALLLLSYSYIRDVAVWNDDTIIIYSTSQDEVEARATRTIAGDNTVAGLGAWDSNRVMFAYSDEMGLWIWSLTSGEAELILESSDGVIPFARYYSPYGRYLAVMEGEDSFTLDTISWERLPDGVVSLNDRWLLAYDTTAETSELQICDLQPVNCTPVQSEVYVESLGRNLVLSQVKHAEWLDLNRFAAILCSQDDPAMCFVAEFARTSVDWRMTHFVEGTEFDYESTNDLFASITDEDTLWINGEVYDLTDQLDSPIITVEWLNSLFYREYPRSPLAIALVYGIRRLIHE